MPQLTDWHYLQTHSGQRLLEACQSIDLASPKAIERLRRQASHDQVVVAIELTLARQSGFAKFGPAIHAMMCDRTGVQMASSPALARHKAHRFATHLPASDMLDLCSGIGADAMAFTSAGLDPLAVDLDPIRAWMTETNASCRTLVGNVAEMALPCIPLHIDPQRRTAELARRIPTLADLEPAPTVLWRLAHEHPAACIKLFPGVLFDQLPPGEVEIVSEQGRVRQALLWTGPLAQHPRSATTFPAGQTITGVPGFARVGPIGPYVFALDPAVERAELGGTLADLLGLHTPHPASGLLTGPDPLQSPFLKTFEVLDSMPWSLARVRDALAAAGAGIVQVKTRGRVIDPDVMQARLRCDGDTTLTVFIQRFGQHLTAIIARRLEVS